MNVLLVHGDRLYRKNKRIPYLSLMKISAYHKARGDTVGFNVSDPDLVYISRLFADGKHNILAMPKAFWEVHEFSVINGVKIHFEYLDIRLVTPEIAKGLREIHHHDYIHFSYDYTDIEKSVRRGVKHLTDAGIPKGSLMFFLFCETEAMLPDAKYRFTAIRDLGGLPFLMMPQENVTPAMVRIRRKANNLHRVRKLTVEQIFNPDTTLEDEIRRGNPNELNIH